MKLRKSRSQSPEVPILARAFALGVTAGLRSQTPNAVLVLRRDVAPGGDAWRDWTPFRWPLARVAMMVGAVGELIGDKTSLAPSRLEPGAFGGRVAFGAFAGVVIGSEGRTSRDLALGGVAGALGAVGGTIGGYRARHFLTSKAGLPDVPVALIEDGIAVGLARSAVG